MLPTLLQEYIVDTYHPQMLLLHGSRARGKNTPQSDWDMLMIPSGNSPTTVQPFSFMHYSIDIQSLTDISFSKSPSLIPYFAQGILIIDKEQIGEKLQEEAQELYNLGPKELNPADYALRKTFYERCLARLEDNRHNPMIFHYRFGALYERIFRYWFEIRREWSLPIYEALPYIEKADTRFFEMAQDIILTTDLEKKIYYAKAIHQHLFRR